MNTEMRDTVNSVFCEVLENFAFSFASTLAPEESELPQEGMLCASMEFHGPSGGRLDLLAPEAMCRTVAANALGAFDEDEVTEETTMDTLKELLNITCGNLLTATWGTGPVFDLSIPSAGMATPEAARDLVGDPESSHFVVDDDFTVILRLTCLEPDTNGAARVAS